jgi:hypothetical protein
MTAMSLPPFTMIARCYVGGLGRCDDERYPHSCGARWPWIDLDWPWLDMAFTWIDIKHIHISVIYRYIPINTSGIWDSAAPLSVYCAA